MRLPALIYAACFALGAMACDNSGPAAPVSPASSRLSMFGTGAIMVRVHWGEQGLAGKRVEVLELGLEKTTNDDGIAGFRVPTGTYTVRVYGINRGGPALLYVDSKVTVSAYQRTSVDVVDCLPCV